MKKLLAVFLLLFFIAFSLFAEAKTVAMCPYNDILAGYMENGLGIKVNKTNVTPDFESLLSADKRLMEMLLTDSNSKILLIPQITVKDGLYCHRIYLYDSETTTLNQVYTYISQHDSNFILDSVLSIINDITDDKLGLVKLDSFREGSDIFCDGTKIKPIGSNLILEEGQHTLKISSFGFTDVVKRIQVISSESIILDVSSSEQTFENLKITSNVPASVIKESIVLGETPFILDSYTVPTVLRLRSEGFADSIISLREQTGKLDVQMKPSWLADSEVYSQARNKFYLSFARSILIFGAKVIFKSLSTVDEDLSVIGSKASELMLTLSVSDLAYSLFNYCRYAEYTSP